MRYWAKTINLTAASRLKKQGTRDMNAHNQQDKDLIESLSSNELARLETWFKGLNAANAINKAYGEKPLEESTGIHCWYDYFTGGYDPAEALKEDLSAAQ
jgi:hypothetical protein